jgi:hypothetical protein
MSRERATIRAKHVTAHRVTARTARLLAALSLALALLLRLVPTVIQPSLDWGDEIYQATEPAHRLVFGTGLVTWEFVVGIRSWLLPGAIAAVMWPAKLLGGGPAIYMPSIAIVFGSLSLVPAICAWLWCRRVFGAWPALAGASVAVLAPELVYFGARPLAEVVAAHILIAALFLATAPAETKSRSAAAGLLLGLATALRPQILPAAAILFLWPTLHHRWRLAAGAALALAAASLLDWITLGAPSASIWRYVLVNLGGASASFGTQPWFYYGLAEAAIWGIALPIPIALCLLGARRWKLPFVMALALLATHMLIGHKEHRFLYPGLALAAVLAGIGLADVATRLTKHLHTPPVTAALTCAAAWAVLSTIIWFAPGVTQLRHRAQDTLAAADYAATLPNICGIGMGPGPTAWVPYGGYTHLHQNVPVFWPTTPAKLQTEQRGFNLLLGESPQPPFTRLRCFGPTCVARRPGPCTAVPADGMPVAPGVEGRK